jgi:sugar phosphate isomerase/epimerase
MTRRDWALLLAAQAIHARPALRYAVCNETFAGLGFAAACQAVGECGYSGMEIAPFTLGEAVSIVEGIGSPWIQTFFDTQNAINEARPHGGLIRKHQRHIRHAHVNELDGRHPGTGSYDFGDVLHTLAGINYRGWGSLEVFDFSAGGKRIACDSLRYLHKVENLR